MIRSLKNGFFNKKNWQSVLIPINFVENKQQWYFLTTYISLLVRQYAVAVVCPKAYNIHFSKWVLAHTYSSLILLNNNGLICFHDNCHGRIV